MKYAPPIGQENLGEAATYIDGNPEAGIEGSAVPANAIDPPQREIVHAIKSAGLTPSSTDLTQLTQAIVALATGVLPGIATPENLGLVMPDGVTITIDSSGRLSAVAQSSLPAGYIALLPFRAADLAEYCPGWYFCNGDQYALTSPVGAALNALPANFKADWGITVSDDNISIPNMFHSDGRGFFVRAVSGTARTVGSVEQDAMQGHRHDGSFASSNLSKGGDGSGWYNTPGAATVGGPSSDGVNGAPRTSKETKSLNVGMTPAIFLDV